jgi:hypothetical protein
MYTTLQLAQQGRRLAATEGQLAQERRRSEDQAREIEGRWLQQVAALQHTVESVQADRDAISKRLEVYYYNN